MFANIKQAHSDTNPDLWNLSSQQLVGMISGVFTQGAEEYLLKSSWQYYEIMNRFISRQHNLLQSEEMLSSNLITNPA